MNYCLSLSLCVNFRCVYSQNSETPFDHVCSTLAFSPENMSHVQLCLSACQQKKSPPTTLRTRRGKTFGRGAPHLPVPPTENRMNTLHSTGSRHPRPCPFVQVCMCARACPVTCRARSQHKPLPATQTGGWRPRLSLAYRMLANELHPAR